MWFLTKKTLLSFTRPKWYHCHIQPPPGPHVRPILPQRPLRGLQRGGGCVLALPAHAPLCRLRGDRLVGMDRVTPGLQRLPLQRLLPLPPGSEHEADQPRHRPVHHQRPEADERHRDAVLRAGQALLHQPAVLWRRWECGAETVQRHGGWKLWLPLTSASHWCQTADMSIKI